MKCPHCNSSESWRSGWHQSKQGPVQIYRCKTCDRKFQERYLGSYIKGKHLTDEHKRSISYALRRTYGKMTPEELKELHGIQHAGRKPRNDHPDGQQRFLGMLGDIEVYEINFGRVGRSPQGLPGEWGRPIDGKPELRARKPT
jgi:hypothetical protein